MREEADAPVALDSILCTEELSQRPSRPAEFERENRALIGLIQAMVDSPNDILQKLTDTICEMLRCGSAGISLLTSDGGTRFYWPAISGIWKPHIGGGTPRNFGPCGDVLDRNRPLLFKHVERRYTYFLPVQPAVEEALLVPFYLGGVAKGTVWAVSHDDNRQFDAEDKRQLETLAHFASAAYQTALSLDAEVAARMLQVQDVERRRIARELHDGVGQLMAAIGMNVSQVLREKDRLSDRAANCVVENMSLIDRATSEIRTVSYLLHPPTLDEMGLSSALGWFVEGFSQRSKISVTLQVAPDLGRLAPEHELVLFRVVQECLTNIHRHSGSPTANVRLLRTAEEVRLEVEDSGTGMDATTTAKIASGVSVGVGMRGMQERVKSIRGRMIVRSTPNGTLVVVTLPIAGSSDMTQQTAAH
jgi:signal transduction histidine kinase